MVAEPTWTNFVASCRSRLVSPDEGAERGWGAGGVLGGADGGPFLGGGVEGGGGGGVAPPPRHVGHHHGGIAGDVFGHVPRQEPRVDVVAAAGRRADDHR